MSAKQPPETVHEEREVLLLRQENAWLRQERDEARQQVHRLRAYLEANLINADTGQPRPVMGGRKDGS